MTARVKLSSTTQTRELEQKRFCEDIISELYREICGEDFTKILGGIAQMILWHISTEELDLADNPVGPHSSNEMLRSLLIFRENIDAPAREFVGEGNEEERKFILGMILQNIVVEICTPSSTAYAGTFLFPEE